MRGGNGGPDLTIKEAALKYIAEAITFDDWSNRYEDVLRANGGSVSYQIPDFKSNKSISDARWTDGGGGGGNRGSVWRD